MAMWIVGMHAIQEENDRDITSPDLVEQVGHRVGFVQE
jgi:hypothetical protein